MTSQNGASGQGNGKDSFREKYGPWAFITGASSGIGAEFSKQLAEKGLNLVLAARRKDRLDSLAIELIEQYGVEVKTVQVDLSRADFMDSIRAVTDPVEVGLLVNNAGVSVDGKFLENSLDDELRMLDINCRAPLVLASEFGNKMVSRKRGGIIFLASMVAFQGTPYWTNYAATKAYSLLLAEGMNYELKKDNVDVLALSPGFTKTELSGNYDFSKAPAKPMDVKPVVESALKEIGHKTFVIPGGMNSFLNFMQKHFLTRSYNTTFFGNMMAKILSNKI